MGSSYNAKNSFDVEMQDMKLFTCFNKKKEISIMGQHGECTQSRRRSGHPNRQSKSSMVIISTCSRDVIWRMWKWGFYTNRTCVLGRRVGVVLLEIFLYK